MGRASLVIGRGLPLLILPVVATAEGAKARIMTTYDRLPLRFERNDGQVKEPVRYLFRGPGYTLYVMPTQMVFSLRRWDGHRPGPRLLPPSESRQRPVGAGVLRVKLLKARRQAQVEGLDELPGKSNYFIGDDPKKWRTNVPSYARVRCRGVYPGIDLVYHSRRKELEYDFVVAPGADPRRIRLGFEGARSLRVDEEGNLLVRLEAGEVVQRAPLVYQEAGSRKDPVRGRWVLRGKKEAGFEIGDYDTRQTLVIDPVLSYSTYLGGSGTDAVDIGRLFGSQVAVDSLGSAYVTGQTDSTDFPTQNPYQGDQPSTDVFVTKLSPSGDSLVYSTYLGGSYEDLGLGITVDGSGNAYVTGVVYSTDFPTQDPYQTNQGHGDAFVTKLSPSGSSLVYSTYLGGSGSEEGEAIAVDGSGSAYVTGYTDSTNFPTQNPYQTSQRSGDAFVTKLAPSGSSLVYSTYLGGGSGEYGQGIAVDSSGSAYVSGTTGSSDFPTQAPYQGDQPGSDAFVTKLSPSGSSLVYSTYLGGSSDYDLGHAIAVDSAGSAYVAGWTASPDFPTQDPYQTLRGPSDAYVTKLSPSGSSLVYSTYLGGSGGELAAAIAVDGAGNAYVAGVTSSTDFPTQDPYQAYQALNDVFVTKLSPFGDSLVYSTYLGGNADEQARGIAVDSMGNAYAAGWTSSTDFPTQNPYQLDQPWIDFFLTKFVVPPPPPTAFFTLSPCRLVDTRNPGGPNGAPALVAGAARAFTAAGQCGIPLAARAIAVNVAVTAPSAAGNLRLYPAGTGLPLASSLNYAAGQTRSNNAIVSLNDSGAFAVYCAQASGTIHLIVDVSGYFQ